MSLYSRRTLTHSSYRSWRLLYVFSAVRVSTLRDRKQRKCTKLIKMDVAGRVQMLSDWRSRRYVLAGPVLKAHFPGQAPCISSSRLRPGWITEVHVELCCEKGSAWGHVVCFWLPGCVLLCVNQGRLPILSRLEFSHWQNELVMFNEITH